MEFLDNNKNIWWKCQLAHFAGTHILSLLWLNSSPLCSCWVKNSPNVWAFLIFYSANEAMCTFNKACFQLLSNPTSRGLKSCLFAEQILIKESKQSRLHKRSDRAKWPELCVTLSPLQTCCQQSFVVCRRQTGLQAAVRPGYLHWEPNHTCTVLITDSLWTDCDCVM